MPVAASQTLREGRRVYFSENGLPKDGGYDDRWVVIRVRGVPVFAFPNTDDALLERRVGEVRAAFGLERPEDPAGPDDRAAFRRWAALALGLVWGPLLPIGLLLAGWLGGSASG